MPPWLLEITESGPSWISAHVLRYIDEGISCVHLFNFLKFLYSGACLQTCWSLLPPLQWGFIMPICQQVLDMCRMLFSRLNVIASSWIVFLQDIVLHTYLKIIYIFIGVAPYDYIYSSCSYIVCCPQLCDFSHQKRISGDKYKFKAEISSCVY